MVRAVLVLSVVVGLWGCAPGGGDGGAENPDRGVALDGGVDPDGARPDRGRDGGVLDAGLIDSESPDSQASDSQASDSLASDSQAVDMAPPDMTAHDMAPPDLAPPDLEPPDMAPPDRALLDADPVDVGDPDVCRDGADQIVACGLNGRGWQPERCVAGRWVAEACDDPDECVDGDDRLERCGLNDRGVRLLSCAQGEWEDFLCEDPDVCVDGRSVIERCPFDPGEGRRVCVEGAFGELHGCPRAPLCPPAGVVEVGVPVEGVAAGSSRSRGWCGGSGAEATWSFTAPAAGRYLFDSDGSRFEAVVYVRSDCDDRDSELACSRDPGFQRGEVEVQLAAGEAVAVYVDAYTFPDQPSGGGAYSLRVTDTSLCAHGAVEQRGCLGDLGVEERVCDRGEWMSWSGCLCPAGEGAERACGYNGRGVQPLACVEGVFEPGRCADPDECTDGDVDRERCPEGAGFRDTVCVEGQLEAGPCAGGVCPPQAVAVLGTNRAAIEPGPSQLSPWDCARDHGHGPEATWAFTTGAAGQYTFDTSGTAFDTVLYLRAGCGDWRDEFACNDDGGESVRSRLTLALGAERTYTVVVDSKRGGTGQIVLSIAEGDMAVCNEEAAEPNDVFDDLWSVDWEEGEDTYETVASACGDNADLYAVWADVGCRVTGWAEVLAGVPPVLRLHDRDEAVIDEAREPPLEVGGEAAARGDMYLSVTPEGGDSEYRIEAIVECDEAG